MKGPRADIGFPDYRLAKQGRDIVVYAPVLRVKTDITLDRNKTIGVITAKGDGNVLMAAHSGFRIAGDRDEKCLDTNKWNYIALHHIAALLKFHFPGNRHDNGNKPVEDEHRGRAHAGHVEVLLAAWYALELTKKSSGNQDADLEWLLTQLHTLKRATLGHARSAVIMIDSQPCATCLKFINRLFQYTGLHFSVKGGVGIGPTLATKDKYNNRYDTFGDVFEMSDGEDSTDSGDSGDSGLQSPPTIVRAQDAIGGVRDTIEDDEERDDTLIQAQAASEAFARVSNLRFSPILDMDTNSDTDDVSPTTPLAVVAPSRAPITPMRPRMQWPILEPASRTRIAIEDPFRDIPSRRPENHLELLAEYKKKTPVFDFPGYESVSPEYRAIPKYRPQHPTPRAAAAGPFTTSIFAAAKSNDSSPEPLEDTILVDMTEDNEDVGYPSPGGSSGTTTLRNSMVEVNPRTNTDTNTNHNPNNGVNTPSPPSRAPAIFSYSSFAPISSQSQRESNAGTSTEKYQSQHQVQVQALSQAQAQSQSQSQVQAQAHTQNQNQNQTQTQVDPVHSDIHMQSCSSDSDPDPDNEDEDDREYYYVPKAHQQPQPHLHPHPHPHSHPQPQPQRPRMRLRFNRPPGEVLSLTPNSNNDSEAESELQRRGRDPTPCPVPVPVPGVTRLQQWRYQPQPNPQTLRARAGVRVGGSERFMTRGSGAGLGRPVAKVQGVTAGPFLGGLEGGREVGFGKKS